MSIINVLSLDMSSTCAGYAKLQYNDKTKKYKILEVNSIKPKGKDLYQRIKLIHDNFVDKKLYEWPHLVILEDYAFNGKAITMLAELNGIIKFNYYIKDIPIIKFASTTVKKQITGSGKSGKDGKIRVQEALKNLPQAKNIIFKNFDESDALAVGITYFLKLVEEENNVK